MTISGDWNAQIFKNSTAVAGSGFSSATQGTSYSVSSLPITINATDTLSVQVQRTSGTVNITSATIIADLTLDNITTAVLLNNLRGDL